MRVSTILSVKGTRYYKAAELFQRGVLSSGTAIRLEHQPHNRHDKNAVAIKIKRTGAMLGHVSKKIAPKYANLVNSNKIVEASISSVEKNGEYININVKVVYEQSDEQLRQEHNSKLWFSASKMPTEAGVYAIQNINSGRQYIGSSINLKNRIRTHIRDLTLGSHANHLLQSDFIRLGADSFEVRVIERVSSKSILKTAEAKQIKSLLLSGASLYNMTEDGQGVGYTPNGSTDAEPISERFARQRAEEELQRINELFSKKRENVINTFEPKLMALLPKMRFLDYFATIFIVTYVVIFITISKLNGTTLFIFSVIFSFASATVLNNYFRKKAKHSTEYKKLIENRDKQLEVIDDEHKKAKTLFLNSQKKIYSNP